MDCISSLIAQMMKCVCVHYQHKTLETSCRILCYSIGCDTEQLRTCIQNFSCKATSTQCINYKMVLGCVLWAHDPLRSAEQGLFQVPFARTSTRQNRAFSVLGPSLWNSCLLVLQLLPEHTHKHSFYN